MDREREQRGAQRVPLLYAPIRGNEIVSKCEVGRLGVARVEGSCEARCNAADRTPNKAPIQAVKSVGQVDKEENLVVGGTLAVQAESFSDRVDDAFGAPFGAHSHLERFEGPFEGGGRAEDGDFTKEAPECFPNGYRSESALFLFQGKQLCT